MATKNPKRKKTNSNLTDPRRTRPSKVPAVIHQQPAKQSGKQVDREIKTLKQQMEFILGVTKTGRKRAEEVLQAEKQKFQTLSEQAPFGLMMINKDGAFEYINPRLLYFVRNDTS